MRPTIPTDKIIAALKATDGMVYLAAERLGCSPDAIYVRRKKCQAVADAIEHARERFLDTAETALKRAVIGGEGWAVCFALKCQGKARGYIEKSEVDHNLKIDLDVVEEIHDAGHEGAPSSNGQAAHGTARF